MALATRASNGRVVHSTIEQSHFLCSNESWAHRLRREAREKNHTCTSVLLLEIIPELESLDRIVLIDGHGAWILEGDWWGRRKHDVSWCLRLARQSACIFDDDQIRHNEAECEENMH